MTSAAYGVGRDSVAKATAECCQARFFLKRNMNREGCRGKIRGMARTIGEGRSLDSASVSALPIDQRPPRRTRAPNTSDGACLVRLSSPGSPPTRAVVAKKADTWQRSATPSAIESRLT
ncbi:MAG: hypothetical protein DRJ61_15345, partial [Acidobacteria bacterium]